MQTGDITKQWMLGNCGKFNRGVGESQNPVFILPNINYQNNYLYYKYFNSYSICIMLNYIHLIDEINS